MNKIYYEIFKILNVKEIEDVEFLHCFGEEYFLAKEDNDRVLNLFNKLITKEKDKYAPYYFYQFKKHNEQMTQRENEKCLLETTKTGFFRAVIVCFDYLFDKYDVLACKNGSEEDLITTLNQIVDLTNKNKDRFLSSKENNDLYYQDKYFYYKGIIDGAICFINDYQNYLNALNAEEMTLELAERFVNQSKWFLIFPFSHPQIKELYVNTLNWLVSQKQYNYLVKLIPFQEKCQPEYNFGVLNQNACLNTLSFLSDGVLAKCIECSKKFIEIFDKLNKEHRHDISEKNKALYKLAKQNVNLNKEKKDELR